MSPDKKVTVSRGLTLRTWKWTVRLLISSWKDMSRHEGMFSYPKAGRFRPSPCRSPCCPPPGSQGSSRTCWQSHLTHAVGRGQAFARGSPSLSLGRRLSRTRPEQAMRIAKKKKKKISLIQLNDWNQLHNSSKEAAVHLLIVRRPDAAGDLTLQVDLRRPVSLSADGAYQDEPIPVGNERLGAVMWPSEVTHLEKRKALVALLNALLWFG